MKYGVLLHKLKEQTSHSPIGPMSVVYDVEFSDQLKNNRNEYYLSDIYCVYLSKLGLLDSQTSNYYGIGSNERVIITTKFDQLS